MTTGLEVRGAATVVTLGAGPARANDDDVIRRGGCNGMTWKLRASPEDGRIEVESELDSNRNGQVWRWRLMHNGSMSARGRATTAPPSGSFEVRRVLVDLSGVDRMRFRARTSAPVPSAWEESASDPWGAHRHTEPDEGAGRCAS